MLDANDFLDKGSSGRFWGEGGGECNAQRLWERALFVQRVYGDCAQGDDRFDESTLTVKFFSVHQPQLAFEGTHEVTGELGYE